MDVNSRIPGLPATCDFFWCSGLVQAFFSVAQRSGSFYRQKERFLLTRKSYIWKPDSWLKFLAGETLTAAFPNRGIDQIGWAFPAQACPEIFHSQFGHGLADASISPHKKSKHY
jgi:hypothetical protein